jgi:hypothetical protein
MTESCGIIIQRAELKALSLQQRLSYLPPRIRIAQMSPNLIMLAAGYGMLMLSYAFIARPYKTLHPF